MRGMGGAGGLGYAAAAAAAAALPLPPGQAAAAPAGFGWGASGASRDGVLVSAVRFTGAAGPTAHGKGAGAGLSPTRGFRPAACWYEPRFTPAAMRGWYLHALRYASAGRRALLRQRYGPHGRHPVTGPHPVRGGRFWAGVVNPARRGDPASLSCDRDPFWRPAGAGRPAGGASPRLLSGAAWSAIRLPRLRLRIPPSGLATVNSPLWVWSDAHRLDPVSVSARLPGISARTTAVPEQVRLLPGDGDAEALGADCPVGPDGRMGVPWRRGLPDPPPCGAVFRRASTAGPVTLRAVVRWRVSWSGTGGVGGRLPDAVSGGERRVSVQEVQTVAAAPG